MKPEFAGELVGWTAAAILLMTVGRQVLTQWRSGETRGVSKWLFIGQIAASIGFVIYSWTVQNWVFVATNTFMLVTAVVGQGVFLYNRSRKSASTASP